MNKDKFIDCINRLQMIAEAQNEFGRGLVALFPDAGVPCLGDAFELPVELLRIIMNDDDDWIGYFIYELDYGKDYKDGCAVDAETNTDIVLKTPSDLYDFLTKQ